MPTLERGLEKPGPSSDTTYTSTTCGLFSNGESIRLASVWQLSGKARPAPGSLEPLTRFGAQAVLARAFECPPTLDGSFTATTGTAPRSSVLVFRAEPARSRRARGRSPVGGRRPPEPVLHGPSQPRLGGRSPGCLPTCPLSASSGAGRGRRAGRSVGRRGRSSLWRGPAAAVRRQ